MSWFKEKLSEREQLKELNKIRAFLEAHLKEWENREKDIQVDIFESTRFILESLIDSYDSIHTLYSKKHLGSCIILARTILENSVNLKYIYQKDTERRAHNFIVFPMKTWLERAKDFKDLKEEDALQGHILIAKMEKEMETYFPTGSNKNHWDGKRSIKELFEELNLKAVYTEGYTRLSGFIHAQYKNEKGVDMHTERPYFNFIRKFIFRDILLVTLETLKIINEKYDLLEGGMIIGDYPEKGAVLFFSVNNKKY